jgi:hypothetical protein
LLPVLLHIHVPRASGSSLHAWFQQGLGEGGVAQANAAADVQRAVADRQDDRRPAIVSGHFLYGVHQILDGHPYRYVVLLRDPVKRVLSLFRYIHNLPAHKTHKILRHPDMTIARFYADRLPAGGVRNGMVAQLAGILGARVTPGPEHLEQAKAHLFNGQTMFGLAEQPAPLLKQAANFLDIRATPTLPEVNRLSAPAPWGGSEEDMAAIVAANQLDMELYREARANLTAAP